jgi:ribosomal protein L11 methyltransferase
MALELLEASLDRFNYADPPPEVLDVGTGTGVLAIAAKLLGGGLTVCCDLDSAAVFTARINFGHNRIAGRDFKALGDVKLFVGSADAVKGPFEVVLANLAAPTLVRMSDLLPGLVRSYLILSGIADAMVQAVIDAYDKADLTLVKRLNRAGWNGMLLEKRLRGEGD